MKEKHRSWLPRFIPVQKQKSSYCAQSQGKYNAGYMSSDLIDISIIKRLPSLEVCSLSVNSITTLQDFQDSENLQELYIRKNKIEDINEIWYLTKLPRLRVLWLADNPCDEVENYRMTVLKALPNLQKLDNSVVTEDEVNQAITEGMEIVCPVKIEPEEVEEPDPDDKQPNGDVKKEPTTFSWEETNKIREQLGLKPLPFDKITPTKPLPDTSNRHRSSNILQAVLFLIKELDQDGLDIVKSAVTNRLEHFS